MYSYENRREEASDWTGTDMAESNYSIALNEERNVSKSFIFCIKPNVINYSKSCQYFSDA